MFGEKILRLIAGLFIGAYVARYLGPAQYGLINYVISLVTLFSVLADFGIQSLVIKQLIGNEERKDVILGTAFIIKLVGILLVILTIVLVVEVSNTDKLTRLLIYITTIGTFFEVFKIIEFYFQSKVWSKFIVWAQVVALVIVSIYRIILVELDASLVWFAWTYSLDIAICSLCLICFYFKSRPNFFSWRFDLKLTSSLLKESWPLILSSFAASLYMKIDQVMIKWMLGDEANGYYGVAVRLCEMWNFIPIAICASLFPAILNAKITNESLYLSRLQWLYDLMVFISISIAIPMTFLSGIFINMLYGKDFAVAGDITALYIWSGVFVFLGVANSKAIITENLQRFQMISFVVAALINVLLNIVLMKYIGLNGAAIATLISYSCASYFGLLFSKRTRPMFKQLTNSLNLFSLGRRLIKEF